MREELPRQLGLLDAVAVLVGTLIGSGIFIAPILVARALPSGPAILAAWVFAGVLSFFGALVYGELGAMMPAMRRRRPEVPRPYRMGGYPVTPLLFVAAAAAFVLNTVVAWRGPAPRSPPPC